MIISISIFVIPILTFFFWLVKSWHIFIKGAAKVATQGEYMENKPKPQRRQLHKNKKAAQLKQEKQPTEDLSRRGQPPKLSETIELTEKLNNTTQSLWIQPLNEVN